MRFRRTRSGLGGSYAKGKREHHLSELGGVVEDLEQAVEVAGGALVFETDGIALFSGQVGHAEPVRAVSRLPVPGRLDVAFLVST